MLKSSGFSCLLQVIVFLKALLLCALSAVARRNHLLANESDYFVCPGCRTLLLDESTDVQSHLGSDVFNTEAHMLRGFHSQRLLRSKI